MNTHEIYALPSDQTGWAIDGKAATTMSWNYGQEAGQLVALYNKGKQKQWNADVRIDWSSEIDFENPIAIPDQMWVAFADMPIWKKMSNQERAEYRRHALAHQLSQFLHGEQGALVCAARLVETVPTLDAKLYAATQVVDEARHVEVFSRFLHQKLGIAYPIMRPLKTLLEQVISDSRWDFTFLGMQVLVEGVALTAFSMVRNLSQSPLLRDIHAFVMQDEARHVAFGREALQHYYRELSDAERGEREEFVVEASYHLRDQMLAPEFWERAGLPVDEVLQLWRTSPKIAQYRKMLFQRIVPTIKSIGLWGDRVQRAYADMGVIDFASLNPTVMEAADEQFAVEIERSRAETERVMALGRSV